MAKHPVPKKKTSKGRTTRRYKAFKNTTIKKLKNRVNLTNCPKCGRRVLLHHACQNCGVYRDKKIIDMSKEIEKVTRIKA